MVKNYKLARAISDANWGELLRQLEYKAEWQGRQLIKIDRYFPSSKRYSNCGHVVEKLPLNIREWKCQECGTHHDRDINAAINILAAGLAVSVCGATVRPEGSKSPKAGAMKQKAPNSDVKESSAVSQSSVGRMSKMWKSDFDSAKISRKNSTQKNQQTIFPSTSSIILLTKKSGLKSHISRG